MISSDLRSLAWSMRAHIDADMATAAAMKVFAERLAEIAAEAEELEKSAIPKHLQKARKSSTPQLELINGGRR